MSKKTATKREIIKKRKTTTKREIIKKRKTKKKTTKRKTKTTKKKLNGNLILFHVKWCPHCTEYLPKFEEFKKKYKKQCNIQSVDVNKPPKEFEEKVSDITRFPTIRYYPRGLKHNKFEDYEGIREENELLNFLNKFS